MEIQFEKATMAVLTLVDIINSLSNVQPTHELCGQYYTLNKNSQLLIG